MFCVPIFLHYFLLLLLFFAVDYSHSSPSKVNLRYERVERETSSLTDFPRYGNFNLVLENGDDFLKFEMCCKNGCHQGSFLFCFEANQRLQDSECGAGTCAYQIVYKSDKSYSLFGFIFNTMDTCFKGKLTNERMYVYYSEGGKDVYGCPLALDSENRLNIFIRSMPDGVNVTALNAKKYVPLTTTISPLINTTELSQTESDEGMSDGVKYTLIGIGILLLLLIICGIGCGIYYCRKPKKTTKPAPIVTKMIRDTHVELPKFAKTEESKEVETIKSKIEAEETKPSVPKRKKAKKMKKESKNRHPKKAAPTNIISSAEPAPSKEPIINPSAEQPKESKKVEKSKSKSKTKSETVQYSPPFCLLPLPNEFPDHESQPIQRRGYRGGIRDSLQLEVQDSRQQPECYEGLRRKRRK